MARSGIYAIVNMRTGRTYVGSTVHLTHRWSHHKYLLQRGRHHCAHLQRAWRKYGASTFEPFLIEVVAERDRLVEREQFWLDAFAGRLYNSDRAQPSGFRGRHHSPEVKAMFAALRRRHVSVAQLAALKLHRHAPKSVGHRASLATSNRDALLALNQAKRERPTCKRGHAYTAANTYIRRLADGQVRVCRACEAARARERRKEIAA